MKRKEYGPDVSDKCYALLCSKSHYYFFLPLQGPGPPTQTVS